MYSPSVASSPLYVYIIFYPRHFAILKDAAVNNPVHMAVHTMNDTMSVGYIC